MQAFLFLKLTQRQNSNRGSIIISKIIGPHKKNHNFCQKLWQIMSDRKKIMGFYVVLELLLLFCVLHICHTLQPFDPLRWEKLYLVPGIYAGYTIYYLLQWKGCDMGKGVICPSIPSRILQVSILFLIQGSRHIHMLSDVALAHM